MNYILGKDNLSTKKIFTRIKQLTRGVNTIIKKDHTVIEIICSDKSLATKVKAIIEKL